MVSRAEVSTQAPPEPINFLINNSSARRIRIALTNIGLPDAYSVAGEEGSMFEFPQSKRQVLIPEGHIVVSVDLPNTVSQMLFWEEYRSLETAKRK